MGLCNYITEQFTTFGVDNELTFDCGTMSIYFKNSVDIDSNTDPEVLTILGLPQITPSGSWFYTNISASLQPIKLSGPSCIHVNTDLPLFNIPQSGRLATIGVNVCYGELLLYTDDSASQPPLLTSQYIDTISIQLTDEKGEELECYDEIPWACVLSIDPVENSGYNSLTEQLNRTNIESTII